MFGLLKALAAVAVLLGAVVAGLAYLPDKSTKKMGAQAAGVFSKGCRGGRMLMDSFKENLKTEAAGGGQGDGKPAPADRATPPPAE